MSTILDYLGRTYDVMAFQGVKATGEARLRSALADEESAGTICTGTQKLAQRWLIEFLTERGSMPYASDRGSTFMQQLRQGFLRNDTDVQIAFTFAAGDIERNLVAEESASDPPDERFAGAELTGIQVQPGSAVLAIRIASRAGRTRQVIMPIATTI